METIKVEFTRRCEPQDKSGRVFEDGSVHRLPSASARHWIKRGAARVYQDSPKKETKFAAEEKTLEKKKEVKKDVKA